MFRNLIGENMNNANIILSIQVLYDSRTREEILNNLNIAVQLAKKLKGLPADRYRALPEVTNRSKHSVMSWFNRPEKKIPLIDLCMVARYFDYNIFSFFTIPKRKGKKEVTVEDFLMANEYNNTHYPVDSADIFIRAFNLQYNTDKEIVLTNLENHYGTGKDMIAHKLSTRQSHIRELCGCTKQTYYAWFNRSRKNVKIPLIPLCQLAIDMECDIFDLFVDNTEE